MSQKTFLLFAPWFVAGGADRCGLDLLKFFKAQGWRVVAVATREHGTGNIWRHKFDAICDEVIDLGADWRAGNTSARIRDVVLRLRPRAICVNNSHEAFACSRMMFEILPDCLMTCLIHMELPGAWDFTGQLISGLHKWFHRILTVSNRLVGIMAERGVPAEKLTPVHWFGYEKEPEAPVQRMMRHIVRQQFAINEKQFTVVFPMRLQEQKQPMLLPRIAKAMIPRGGNPAFIVAGDGRYSARVRAQVEQDGTAANFRFLGDVEPENMAALYAASDALCLPSLDEGVPLVLFEAMQSGLPIVASNVGAVSELVVNTKTGILIEQGAHRISTNYAEALRWIMQNKPDAHKLAEQARQHVRQGFSFANWQTRVASAFNDAGIPAKTFIVPRRVPIEKVFIIGAPRTGTTSVGQAMAILGYRDYGHDPYLQELWQHGNYEPIWERVGMHDSFSDGPFNTGNFYQALAEKYPHAKFILTVRNKQTWKESHRRHFDPDVPNRDVKPRFKMHRYEPETWWRWYDRRNAEIRAFFQTNNRPHHLLEFTIGEEREPWARLVDFLGSEANIPSPLPPFPHANKFQP